MKTLCDYELSRLAKEVGYNEPSECHINDNGKFESEFPLTNSQLQKINPDSLSCPQLNDLQDWLLEAKGIWVMPDIEPETMSWEYNNLNLNTGGCYTEAGYESKDTALSEGMKSYLKSEEGV